MKEIHTVNVSQAASIAGVSDNSITSWIREGVLPCITDAPSYIIGRAALYEVLAFRASNGRHWVRRFLKRVKPAAGMDLPFARPEPTKPEDSKEVSGLHENCGPDFMWCARAHGCEALSTDRAEAIRDVLEDAGVSGEAQVSVWLIDTDGDPAGAASKFWVRVWREVRYEAIAVPSFTQTAEG